MTAQFHLEIVQDTDPISPREDDNVGTIALLASGRYRFGDRAVSHEEMGAILRDPQNIILPVYLYDHSGVTINTTGFSCPWDSGQVGIIYCSRKKAVEEWGVKKCTQKVVEKAKAYMEGEIETLDQYLRGDVYGYVLTDSEGTMVDSCWGFYGKEYAEEEGNAAKKAKEEEHA